MSGRALLKEPASCTVAERRDFARVVRQGFPRARDLEERVRAAHRLAFYYPNAETLGGIAALKAPAVRYCDAVFAKAAVSNGAAGYPLELGWIFVAPPYRGSRIAERLCRELMMRVPASGVFATTRPDNAGMIGILERLGFSRIGKPYPRGDEQLVLYVRAVADTG